MANFERDYQSKLTQIVINTKNKLNKKYDQINKKLAQEQRKINLQRKDSYEQFNRLYKSIAYTNEFSEHPECLNKNKSGKLLPSSIVTKNNNKINTVTKTIEKKYQFSKYFSNVPNNKDDQNKEFSTSYYDKIKMIQNGFKNVEFKSANVELLKKVNEKYDQKFYENFINSTSLNITKSLREHFKKMSQKLEKKTLPIKPVIKIEPSVNEKEIINENRIKYIDKKDSDLVNHVKLIQRILRGRTYQTMLIEAKKRYKLFLEQAMMAPVTKPAPIIKNKSPELEIIELSFRKYISRFFDTISMESIMQYNNNINNAFNERAEFIRIMTEAVESNKREFEERTRVENDELLKHVINFQQELSKYAADIITEEAIKQCAKKEGTQLIEQINEKRLNEKSSDDEYSDNEEPYTHNITNMQAELVYNYIIPEVVKIIHRNENVEY